MQKSLLCAALLALAPLAMAAGDEAALKKQMHEACAPLFATGGACADLAKGTRKCTRQNADKGGASCAAFEKANKDFFDAGMNDPIIKK
jgi:hypothetical protein